MRIHADSHRAAGKRRAGEIEPSSLRSAVESRDEGGSGLRWLFLLLGLLPSLANAVVAVYLAHSFPEEDGNYLAASIVVVVAAGIGVLWPHALSAMVLMGTSLMLASAFLKQAEAAGEAFLWAIIAGVPATLTVLTTVAGLPLTMLFRHLAIRRRAAMRTGGRLS